MNLIFPRFALGLLAATVAFAETATAAGPARLSKLQMDTISAGTVGVASHALAGAFGNSTYTSTHTVTHTASAPVDNGSEVGVGIGTATACCGPYTAADVWTDSYADGLNQSRHRVNIDFTMDFSSKAFGVETVASDNRTGSLYDRPYYERPRDDPPQYDPPPPPQFGGS